VAEPGCRRRPPGARLHAAPGAPPSYQRTLGADADEVAELVLGRAFRGALWALPTTSVAQHRHHHPGCRWVFIGASRREKKEEPEEEWEQIPPELLEETRPWWVEDREMLANLSRHPDDTEDALGLALAVAHSLAGAGGAIGGAPNSLPVFDISDNDEDVKPDDKPDVKMEDGGADNSTRWRRGGGHSSRR
jgi:hypothetical protein